MFTEYNAWFTILLVVISAVAALWLYFYKNKKTSFTQPQRIILTILRFLGIFLILFLLLSPIKKTKTKTIEKPLIIIAQDNSSSIISNKYASLYKSSYLKNLQNMISSLKDDYNIKTILFGSNPKELTPQENLLSKTKYDGCSTNIENLVEYVGENYSIENLSAMVIASDGIVNEGKNMLNYSRKISYPIYTIAMGDTSIRKDLYITNVEYNKIAFLNSSSTMELTLAADKLMGKKSSLFITQNGRTTRLKDFSIDNNDYSLTIPIKIVHKKSGIEKISLYVQNIDDETNEENNHKDIFIEVLDTKKSVLILASYPHADISALKSILEQNSRYSIDVDMIQNLKKNPLNYDLVIMHNLPSNANSFNIAKKLQNSKTPMLFIVGQGASHKYFNLLNLGIEISPFGKGAYNYNQVIAKKNPSFALFNADEVSEDFFAKMPPLLSIAAKYNTSSNIQTLMYQKIGSVSTTYPLIAFNDNEENRYGFIMAENIWRWRLMNYAQENNFDEVDNLINKSIQLTCNKTKKERFRIDYKNIYLQRENVEISAELYNDNYEPTNAPEANITISGKNYSSSFVFGKTERNYLINIGRLPVGEYHFRAKTSLSCKKFEKNGVFVVSSEDIEKSDLTARHSDLFTMSQNTKGKMFYPNEIKNLQKSIEDNEDIKPIIHVNTENKKFISLWWYWAMIVMCFGAEWVLRKYWGK